MTWDHEDSFVAGGATVIIVLALVAGCLIWKEPKPMGPPAPRLAVWGQPVPDGFVPWWVEIQDGVTNLWIRKIEP